MRNIWVIAEKEYKHYFISPIAYFVALAILGLLGIFFFASILAITVSPQGGQAPGLDVIIIPLTNLLLFFTPGITMRSMAEEQRSGTLELLLTAPVRDWEVVVGKWLGAMLFMITLLAATWFFPIVLNSLVNPGIDQGILVSGYLGIVLLSSSIIAIGVMLSSFFSNQIAALFSTWFVLLVLWIISYPAQITGNTGNELLRYLDIAEHFYPTFLRGMIDLKDIVYYLSVTAIALFFGTITVEARRWK